MGRRTALILGAVMLAATPALARAQTTDAAGQVGVPPSDMPPADGARMAALEIEASAAVEAGDWPRVERLIREGLALEQRHYAADDARIGHSWGWLARAAQEQGRPPAEIIPLWETRLRIAEAHPEDPETLAAARYNLGVQLMAADRAAEAAALFRGAEGWLSGGGEAQAESLRTVRISLAQALVASGDKAGGADAFAAVLAGYPQDGDADERAYLAWALAVALIDLERFAEAEAPLRLAMDRHREAGRVRDEALAAYWLADVLRRAERGVEADALLMRVIALETAAPAAARALRLDQVRATILPLADRLRETGRHEEAVAAYQLVIETDRTRPDERGLLAAALNRLGLSLYASGRHAEAIRAQQEALELWKAVRTAPHADIATQQEQLGQSQLRGDRHLEALRNLSEAATMRAALGQEQTTEIVAARAEALRRTGRLESSLALRRQLIERLAAESPQRTQMLADAWYNAAYTAYQLDQPAEAETMYRLALTMSPAPRLKADIMTGLAFALTTLGRGAEGEPMLRQVMADAVARDGANSTGAAIAMNDLANLLGRRRDFARSEPLIRDALAIFEGTTPPDPAWVATLKLNLGVTVGELGRHQEALRLLADAYTARRDIFGAGHPLTVAVIERLGLAFVAVGAYDRAEPLFAQMVTLRETQLGPDHPGVADALQNHAYVLQSKGDFVGAEALMRRAVAIVEASSQDPRDRIRFNANWAISLTGAGRAAEAVGVFRHAGNLMIERRRTAGDPSWSRGEADALRYLFRHSVDAAWTASHPAAP